MQDSAVLSHTPLLDVRPHGRNQDKPVRYCVVSCINIWDEETRSITSWVRAVGSGRRQLARQVGERCVTFLFCSLLISRDGEQIQPIPHGRLGSATSVVRDLVRES